MKPSKTYHSICRWTFNAGKGGFVPGDARPLWSASKLDVVEIINLVSNKIRPRLPDHIELGFEVHYDTEIDEKTAPAVADALVNAKMYLAMITPGLHSHFGYGGPASLDSSEREAAGKLSYATVDLAYGPLKKAWHPDAKLAPTLVLWNGSYGYDLATPAIKQMYQNLKESVASLCQYEDKKGGQLYIGIEPKPNEGHPAMLLPTVASALLFWKRLKEEFGISIDKRGLNKELGHSEMIGLDSVYDTVEEIDNNAISHMHLNSQGYNDGITLGGPGKYDIDHGVKITGMNIAIASLVSDAGYNRWFGHDMQARAYDNETQAADRVIRSILSWDACQKAAAELNLKDLTKALCVRETGRVEDMMRHAVVSAHKHFDIMYKG
jgi:xylose isomerase